jgi:hypothetical protein
VPLALTYTEGVISPAAIQILGKQVTDAFLKWHNLSGNTVMTPNVTMQIAAIPKAGSLSGGEAFSGAWLECKVPSFALADRSAQEGFFSEATDLIEASAKGAIPRAQIFGNAVHTVDGTWNMDGRPMTNEEMGTAISAG